MRTPRKGPRKRRSGTPWTLVLCILLMAVASVGCNKGQTAREGASEETKNLTAPRTPASEDPPGAQPDAAEESAPKQPKIRFDQPDYDFGEIEAGDEVEHTFVFGNVGDGPLSIQKVLTSCGCTGALASDDEIPPGGTGEIIATFHTKGFHGTVKKSLTVESNDPEDKLVRLTIGGNVVSEVTVEPRYLNWETIQPEDSPRPRRLTIRFLQGRGLRLEKIQSESPSLVLTKESEDENKVIYSVTLAEDLPSGRFTGRITIRSNSERVPEIRVPFQGEVQGNVKVIPHILFLGKVRPGKALTRHLSVSKTGKQGFTVQEVKTTSEAIVTEIREEKQRARYRIKVTYIPGSKAQGRIAERITILVDDGEKSYLEVPVYGTVDTGDTETPSS